jgi:hypothetical protein
MGATPRLHTLPTPRTQEDPRPTSECRNWPGSANFPRKMADPRSLLPTREQTEQNTWNRGADDRAEQQVHLRTSGQL